LITKEEFDAERDGAFGQIITISEKEEKAKKVAFTFEYVPADTYAIQVFQDVNDNGELDMGMFGPKEPWGNYRHKRPKFRGPKFEEMAFEVKENLSDIQITLK